MLHPISQSVFRLIIMMVLIGTPAFIEAAQAARTKAQKAPAAKEDPGPWLLAGRDGECVPLSILSKKGPEYSDIQSPHQLAEKLRAAGHEAEIKEFNAGTRPGGRGARVFGRARRDVYRKGSLRQTAAYCRKQIIVNSRALLAGVSAGRLAAKFFF